MGSFSYRWCYLHYRKSMMRAMFQMRLSDAEKQEIKKIAQAQYESKKPIIDIIDQICRMERFKNVFTMIFTR